MASTTANLKVEKWGGGARPMKVSYGKLMMWFFLLSDALTFTGFLLSYGALRMSNAAWPVPDHVFSTFPGGLHHKPLIFVTLMTFVLIVSSVTMFKAVQEGHRENKGGVAFWMLLTIVGGLTFLGCQAWEWNTLINKEHMTLSYNPFARHTENGTYLEGDGHEIQSGDSFKAGDSYMIHKHEGHWKRLKYKNEEGVVKKLQFGPQAFGQLFFCITGFHGFHVFTGVLFLLIIMLNVISGLYAKRKNHYEMVEKVGLYWHFVDLVWVFVFLCFYLL